MHEKPIVESLLALALQEAGKAQANKIRKISLVVGDLSGIVDEAVELYFSLLSRDTIAEGAGLSFEHIPARMRCRNCDITFTAENLNFNCPKCNEREVEIVSGRELRIESMEIE